MMTNTLFPSRGPLMLVAAALIALVACAASAPVGTPALAARTSSVLTIPVYPPPGYVRGYIKYDVIEYLNIYAEMKKRFHVVIFELGEEVYHTPSRIMESFDLIDANLDGEIDMPEWRYFMGEAQTTGPLLTLQERDNLLAALDHGDPSLGYYGAFDGVLSFEEFHQMFYNDVDVI